jgi:hypothetical protein
MEVPSQPRQKDKIVHDTLSQKNYHKKRVEGLVEGLKV